MNKIIRTKNGGYLVIPNHKETRYKGLFYANIEIKVWSMFDNRDGQMAQIGDIYISKNELLSDLKNIAEVRDFKLKK